MNLERLGRSAIAMLTGMLLAVGLTAQASASIVLGPPDYNYQVESGAFIYTEFPYLADFNPDGSGGLVGDGVQFDVTGYSDLYDNTFYEIGDFPVPFRSLLGTSDISVHVTSSGNLYILTLLSILTREGCIDDDSGACDVSNGYTSFDLVRAPAATPLPATLPLLASGLGALGLVVWRRKRKLAKA
jgi:hypothetical protein